jgi:myo-inositol-1(or 4)-monophosphatase
MSEFVTICEQAARQGGEVLRKWQGRFRVREKGPRDLVTEADLASQEAVRRVVLGTFPDHAFLGEEDAAAGEPRGANGPGSGFRWLVDPLDGTTNYVHGMHGYCVSVALQKGIELVAGAVYNPRAEECFTAAAGKGAYLNGERLHTSDVARLEQALVAASFPAHVQRDSYEVRSFLDVLLASQSVRRLGSAALNLCYLAAGRLDAYWATDVKIWDVAAGVLIVREAGGVVTAADGGPFDLARPKIAASATQALHGEFVGVLARGGSPA